MGGWTRRWRVVLLATVLAVVAVGLAPSVASAQDTGTISGTVDRGFPINSPAEGVVVDRFTANADGTRGTYLDSATTNSDGIYAFTVDAGVYILTFIAPAGENFNSTGTPWANVPVTVTAGGTTTANQTLDGGIVLVDAVDDTYEFTVGDTVNVDLTDNDTAITQVGSVQYLSGDLPPGLDVSFPPVGGVYQTLQGTPTTPGTYEFVYRLTNDNGDADTATVTVTVNPDANQQGTISGTVDRGFPINSPAEGVVVDRFTANADGTRGTYLDSATTNSDGVYTFTVEPGSYILTFIAPAGENFNSTGSPWANVPVTVTAGGTTTANQTLDGGIVLVDAVDDTYEFTVGDTVNVDLTDNDTAITQVGSVQYLSGDLPPGLAVSFPPVGGVYQTLQGTPTTPGTYEFIYRLTNDNGDADTATVTVTVNPAP